MKPVLPSKIIRVLQSVIAIMTLSVVVVAGLPRDAYAACSNPVGAEGKIIYNDVYSVLQYCDDTNWIGIPESNAENINTYGLVGRWRFDESGTTTTASDWASGNNGTLTNFATPSTSWQPAGGQLGGSLLFGGNAVNEKVLLGNPTALQISAAITMSAWVKPNATQTVNRGRIISRHNGGTGDHFAINIVDDLTLDCRINNTANLGGGALTAGVWHHVACTYDGTTVRVYLDGAEIHSYAYAGAISTTNTVSIGGHGNSTNRNFRGELDDVRIYNRALTATEINRIVTVETGNTYSSNGYFVETSNTSGNMGGLSGANALCLSRLQTNSWYGKDTAIANGQLTAANVKAWLCTTTTCNNLDKFSTYQYASTINPTNVGATMSIGAGGFIEDDGRFYEGAQAFGTGGGFREYFTGRTTSNLPATDTCGDWTSNAGISYIAVSDTSFYPEKLRKYSLSCAWAALICIVGAKPGCVDPVGIPGDIIYNHDQNMMVYCNGNGWVPFSARMTAPSARGLIAHYKFDHASGTALTDHAGAHTGTATNFTMPAAWTAGHIGSNSLDFDGTDDYVSLATPSDFAFNLANQYSWAFWINPDNMNEWNTVFGMYNGANSQPVFGIIAHTTADSAWGPVTAGISAGYDQFPTGMLAAHSTDNVLTAGTWAHVVVTYNGSLGLSQRFQIYVNGVNVSNTGDVQTTGSPTTLSPTFVSIGSNGWTGENYEGRIDDFRFYQRVLTADEIRMLATYGPATGCANPTATAGKMIYNNTANVVQFCNGKNWVAAGR